MSRAVARWAAFACGPLLFALLGCAHAPPPPAATGPDFHPETWFVGRMHSSGVLTTTLGNPHGLNVDSRGAPAPGGAVRLDQAIRWAGGSVDHRFWIMRPLPGGGYAVSLSDAVGPVAFEVRGARAHLRYRDRRGPLPLMVEQWMDLTADGKALENHGALTILGVPIGRLEETIVHDPA